MYITKMNGCDRFGDNMEILIVKDYKDFVAKRSFYWKSRNVAKTIYLNVTTSFQRFRRNQRAIRFIHYHHVFDDEVKGFEKQLRYLKEKGKFLKMDEACDRLNNSNEKIEGTYFCLSFDDGLKSVFKNAYPVLRNLGIPAIVYLATDFIGVSSSTLAGKEKLKTFYPKDPKIVEFLNWKECVEMQSGGIQFGSHTCSHLHLIDASVEEIEKELKESKRIIEENTGRNCIHFAAPWGKPKTDYSPKILVEILERLGYRSLAASTRGSMHVGGNLMEIKRDQLLANWGKSYLNYFLGKESDKS